LPSNNDLIGINDSDRLEMMPRLNSFTLNKDVLLQEQSNERNKTGDIHKSKLHRKALENQKKSDYSIVFPTQSSGFVSGVMFES